MRRTSAMSPLWALAESARGVPHFGENQEPNTTLSILHQSLLVRVAHHNPAGNSVLEPFLYLLHQDCCRRRMHTSSRRQPHELFRMFALASRSLIFYRHLQRPTQHVVVCNRVLPDQH